MATKRLNKKKLSSKIITLVAAISIIGIIASIFFLSTNLANKPKSTERLCVPARHSSNGVIEEADLGCRLRDERALSDWTTLNHTYGIVLALLAATLIADSIAAYRVHKN